MEEVNDLNVLNMLMIYLLSYFMLKVKRIKIAVVISLKHFLRKLIIT